MSVYMNEDEFEARREALPILEREEFETEMDTLAAIEKRMEATDTPENEWITTAEASGPPRAVRRELRQPRVVPARHHGLPAGMPIPWECRYGGW